MPSHVQGHRERLRQRFAAAPVLFTNQDLLELLLTYAIPQRDVAPTVQALMSRFGSLAGVLNAPLADLTTVAGVGDYTATLVQLVSAIQQRLASGDPEWLQPALIGPAADNSAADSSEATETEPDAPAAGRISAFVNDEVAHSQEFMPMAHRFGGYEEFRFYLREQLPYNAATTRTRRANHILNRFFPNGRWDRTLVQYLQETPAAHARNAVLFYHIAANELLLAQVAEELIWPALAQGQITREEMRAFVLRQLPDLSASSQANVLRSTFNAYTLLGIAHASGDVLHLRLQPGSLDAFVYVLGSEFPQPGMYRFEALEQSPLRKWLLWDKEWIRRQLYLLRDVDVIAKVSEIDTVRQFTLRFGRQEMLQAYWKLDRQELAVLREDAGIAAAEAAAQAAGDTR